MLHTKHLNSPPHSSPKMSLLGLRTDINERMRVHARYRCRQRERMECFSREILLLRRGNLRMVHTEPRNFKLHLSPEHTSTANTLHRSHCTFLVASQVAGIRGRAEKGQASRFCAPWACSAHTSGEGISRCFIEQA